MAHQTPYYEQPTETQYYEQWVGTEGCEQYDETQGYESWGGEGQEQWDDTQSFEPVDATQGYDPCGGQGHGQWDETEGYEPWDETQAWLKEKHYESLLFFNCRHCLFFWQATPGSLDDETTTAGTLEEMWHSQVGFLSTLLCGNWILFFGRLKFLCFFPFDLKKASFQLCALAGLWLSSKPTWTYF